MPLTSTLKSISLAYAYDRVKEDIKSKGGRLSSVISDVGEITHEHKLVKAVTASFPDDAVSTLGAHPAVDEVEPDKQVTTQFTQQAREE
jgi:hypothetical protein